MATKEITKRPADYVDPEIEPRLVDEPEDADETRPATIDRLNLLWENRRFLFRCAVVGFAVAAIVALLIPTRYTAVTRLMPPDQAGQGIATMMAALGKAGDLGAIGTQLLGIKASGDIFIGVLKSDTVENALINKFDLRKVYGQKRYMDARKTLEDRTDIAADRKSGIITIKVSDHDKERAAAMGREYVEQLNHVVITLDTSSAHRERLFLENRLNEVTSDLEQAEKAFSVFASKNATLDVKEQAKAMIGASGELEGELIAAETQLEGLRQIYTPNNVRVRSLQARIDEYKRQLQKLGGKTSNANAAGGSGASSDGQNQDLYPSIRQLPIVGVEWSDLYRRTRIEEAIFETLTKQYELTRVEEARELPSVKVLDVADVPEKKSFPPRTIIALAGVLIAIALGTGWVFGKLKWQQVDPEDPRKVLALSIARTLRHSLKWRRP